MSTAPLSAESPNVMATKPPVARRVPKVDVVHGDRREDDYFWIRDKKDPEVKAYLEAENAYTDLILKPTEGLRESLYKEMLARIKERRFCESRSRPPRSRSHRSPSRALRQARRTRARSCPRLCA